MRSKWPYGTIVQNSRSGKHIAMVVRDSGSVIEMTTLTPYNEPRTTVLAMYNRGKVWTWTMDREFWVEVR